MAPQIENYPDVSLHFVGDEGLLLDRSRQRLYTLNPSAAAVWTCLKQGESPASAASLLSERFALPAEAAASYVGDVLRQYETLSRAQQPSEASAPDQAGDAISASAVRRALRGFRPGAAPDHDAIYKIVDTTFRVRFGSPELFEEIHPLLRHLAVQVGPADAVKVVVIAENSRISVIAGDEVIGSCNSIREAAVMVRACLFQVAITASDNLCAIHACALRRNGYALLLPGEGGAGKSTLSAALAARGFEMLCEDTALISDGPTAVRCVRSAVCVKPGAYVVLAPYYPELHRRPEWRRPDGKRARYLIPVQDVPWAEPQAVAAARWIVFPRYRPGARAELLPLPRHEALARLLQGLYALSGMLDEPTLEKLVAWIEWIDCFELPHSSLEEATSLLIDRCR